MAPHPSRVLAFLIVLCASVHVAVATDLYVDSASSLMTSCGTPASPCGTIESALALTSQGDRVLVAPGPYWPSETLAPADIQLVSTHGAEQTIVDAHNVSGHLLVDFPSWASTDTLVEGFTFTRASKTSGNVGGLMHVVTGASPHIRNCSFTNSVSAGRGVVMVIDSSPRFDSCRFTGNQAMYGGAAYLRGSRTLYLHSCIFESNSAPHGGALYLRGGIDVRGDGITTLSNRATPAAGYGGLAYIYESSRLTLSSSSVTDHAATNDGGVFYVYQASTVTLRDCSVRQSAAQWGGVAFASSASVIVVERTVIANSVVNSGGGGALYVRLGSSLRILNSHMTRCTALDDVGGAVYAYSGASTLVNGTTMSHCIAKYGGALGVKEYATAIVVQSRIVASSAVWTGGNSYGGGVFVQRASISLEDTTIASCMADYGGGVYGVTLSAPLNVTSCTFEGNSATSGDGGGLQVTHDSRASIVDSLFANNTAGRMGGGAIVAFRSTLSLTGTTFRDCRASHGGGGLSNFMVSIVTADRCIFTRCAAAHGGGASIEGPGNISRTQFHACNASKVGGALGAFGSSALVTLHGVNVTANTAFDGGAFYVSARASLSVSMASLEENFAVHSGGAIASINVGASVVLVGATVESNRAAYGGAISYTDGAKVTVTGCSFLRNRATSDGGVVNVQAGNTADLVGAGWLLDVSSTVFVANSAVIGGVVSIVGPRNESPNPIYLNWRMTNCSFFSNTARSAGAIFQLNSLVSGRVLDATVNGSHASHYGGGWIIVGGGIVVVEGSNIARCSAPNSEGGGFVVQSGSTVVRSSVFDSNSAESGGALHVSGGAKLTVTDSVMRDNHAAKKGGALSTVAKATLERCSLSGNSAMFGGAVDHSHQDKKLSLTDVFFAENRASAAGGAIWSLGYAQIVRSTFRNNTARFGGAFQISSSSVFHVIDSVLAGNVAGLGGSVHAESSSSLMMRNSSILESTSSDGGGAVAIVGDVKFEAHDCSFVSNDAGAQSGGGLLASLYSRSTLNATRWESNSASSGGAIDLADKARITITHSSFAGNRATGSTTDAGGGAIHSAGDWVAGLIDSTTLVGNRADKGKGGALLVSGGSWVVRNSTLGANRAGLSGGGISLTSGSLDLDDRSTLADNAAGVRGGGVDIETPFAASSSNNVSRSHFTRNSAGGGGAVHWSAASCGMSLPSGLQWLATCTFESNTAAYGADVATEAVALQVTAAGVEVLFLPTHTSGAVFGSTVPFRAADFYNHTVKTLSVGTVRASIASGSPNGSTVVGTDLVAVTAGTAEFRSLGVRALPGSTIVVTFATDSTLSTVSSTSVPVAVRPCNPGESLDSQRLECVACIAGRYSASPQSPMCSPCAEGSVAAQPGAVNCTSCAAGSFAVSTGQVECIACAKGMASTKSGARTCDRCGKGSFAESTGSSKCSLCLPGSFAPGTGLSGCVFCAPGTNASGWGAEVCTPCPIGSFAATSGSANCTLCPLGTIASSAGQTRCIDCDPGTFASGWGAEKCTRCPVGYFAATSGSANCTVCQPGSFSPSTGQSGCLACQPGTVAPGWGAQVCDRCPVGSFAATSGVVNCTMCVPGTVASSAGQARCVDCDPYTIAPGHGARVCHRCPGRAFTVDRRQCLCEAGTYEESGVCRSCGAGADCRQPGQTLKSMQAMKGYWRVSPSSSQFLACSSCPGGQAAACNPGSDGPLCGVCDPDFGRGRDGACIKCPHAAISVIILLLIVAALLAVLTFTIVRAARPKSALGASIKILLNFLQTQVLLGAYSFAWPTVAAALFSGYQAASMVEFNFIEVDCLFGIGYVGRLVFAIVLPICVVVVPIVVNVSIYRIRVRLTSDAVVRQKHRRSLRKWARRIVLVTLFLIHTPITKLLMEAFACTAVDANDAFLTADLSIKCGSGEHIGIEVAAAVFLFLFTIGIPGAAVIVLYRRRSDLQSSDKAKTTFGFLYLSFSPRFWFWEAVSVLRKSMLACVAVLLSSQSSWQWYAAIVVIQSAIVAHLVAQPFKEARTNFLESLSLLMTWLTLLLGVMFETVAEDVVATMVLAMLLLVFNVVAVFGFLVVISSALSTRFSHVADICGRWFRKRMKRSSATTDEIELSVTDSGTVVSLGDHETALGADSERRRGTTVSPDYSEVPGRLESPEQTGCSV